MATDAFFASARRRLSNRLRDPRLLSVGLTVGAGWIGRLVTAAAQFIAIRQMSVMLGVEGYGAYAVVTGLAGWFALADLGFGASLQNYISARRVSGESVARAISATARVLTATTLMLSAIFIVASFWAGPALLARFPQVPYGEAVAAFAAFAVIATGTGAAAIASRIAFAEHRGYLAHALSAGGAVTGVLTLLILARLNIEHRFVWSLVAYNVPNLLLPVLFLVLRPAPQPIELQQDNAMGTWQLTGDLWRQGRMFLLFNGLAALVLNVDYLILSQTVSAREVATYAIFAKIYALVFFFFNSILQAYWPVSAEAIRRGKMTLVATIIPRMIGIGWLIVGCASLGFWLFLAPIGNVLVPEGNLRLPAALIPLFAAYWLVRVWCDTFGMLILSAGKPMFLCIMVPFQALLNLGLGYAGARYYGLAGLMIGMTLSFALTSTWAAPLYFRRLVRRARCCSTLAPEPPSDPAPF